VGSGRTAPGRRGKNRTLVTALTIDGFGPGLLLDEPIDRATFDGYIIHRLAPTLQAEQIVVVDNLKVYYSDRAKAAIEARGAQLWYLPAYSPDLTPIRGGLLEAHSRPANQRTAHRRGPQHRRLGHPPHDHPTGCRRLDRPRRLRPPPTPTLTLITPPPGAAPSLAIPGCPARHYAPCTDPDPFRSPLVKSAVTDIDHLTRSNPRLHLEKR
jgi:transposase